MLQRFAIAVLVLFVSSGAAAQISPCSGGPTNPLFTLIPGNPVQLKFEHLTIHALTAPTVCPFIAAMTSFGVCSSRLSVSFACKQK